MLSSVFGFADDARQIRERMRERLPEVDALKREQLAGENNKGFLEPRGQLSSKQQTIVREENDDRRKVYEALAAKTRATPEQVGMVRARQIAHKSARGVLIQDEQGEWAPKK